MRDLLMSEISLDNFDYAILRILQKTIKLLIEKFLKNWLSAASVQRRMSEISLDNFDYAILRILQKDNKTSHREISEKLDYPLRLFNGAYRVWKKRKLF